MSVTFSFFKDRENMLIMSLAVIIKKKGEEAELLWGVLLAFSTPNR